MCYHIMRTQLVTELLKVNPPQADWLCVDLPAGPGGNQDIPAQILIRVSMEAIL